MGLREDKTSLVATIFLLGLPLNTETPTLDIITCNLLLLKRPTISQFFQFRSVCGTFFVNHLALPSKDELMPKADLQFN